MTALVAESIVDSAQGRLRGSIKDGVHRFPGVAYGGATAQERRFMPPSPPQFIAGQQWLAAARKRIQPTR